MNNSAARNSHSPRPSSGGRRPDFRVFLPLADNTFENGKNWLEIGGCWENKDGSFNVRISDRHRSELIDALKKGDTSFLDAACESGLQLRVPLPPRED